MSIERKAFRLFKSLTQKVGQRVEQMRMHWIENHAGSKKHTFWQCSHCQRYSSGPAAFCPHCGKPMDAV